ncbi:uncharacterized protein M6B38_359245 [Iris pallida]|uniref:tRNA/rRNA methyltransferase SpoU type domain-containing protein n=1 Tax=Iris pallida TaxID=29817 RepID=A0AAX6GL87_IRIPA|nr:uncharacterized protein M6B38_359245 [Iris pallida]
MDPAGLRALTLRCSPVAAHFLPRLPAPPVLLPVLRSRSRSWLSRNPNKASTRLLSSASCSLEKSDADTLYNGIARAGSEVSCDKLLQVVLVSPQIPGNTGCIARTCAASAIGLHLVEPLGYTIDDAKLKRAGLDYWPYVVVKIHSSWSEFRDYFMRQNGDKRLLAFTKRGTSIHSDISYKRGDWLVFGSETSGLPPEALLDCNREGTGGGTVRIPMVETYVRCLNLSVSVGIALYEASRQLNFEQFHLPTEADAGNERLFISEDIFG